MAEKQESIQESFETRLLDQERAMNRRLDSVGQRVGAGLEANAEKTKASLAQIGERLAVMDEAQKNIIDLSNRMVSLQDILSNKQARGAFGQIQLRDLVESIMPPDCRILQIQPSKVLNAWRILRSRLLRLVVSTLFPASLSGPASC